jgi:benzoyl-CoA reductase/2-hydroxyglutaryl-CoA dehydratase subunit BcrC/BadD/HgdB
MPRLESTARLQALMLEAFRECDAAARAPQGRVAWCTSVGPVELLRALGFAVFFPENHAAMLGASRAATDLIPAASAEGYSPDVCSYMTSDIGAFRRGVTALSRVDPSITSVPRPDVLVYDTNQCRDVVDWFSFYGRQFGVPVIGVAAPRGVDAVTDDLVAAVASQIRGLVAPLEAIAGRRLDPGRLRDAVAISRDTSLLWRRVLSTGSARPSPLTFFDACIHMGPAVILRGDPRSAAYYEGLLAELEGRIARGVAAVPGERVRLYWEGMPIWGRLRDVSDLLARLGACVAGSTYCSSWVFDALDPAAPFDSMARASVELFITRTDAVKERVLADEARRYSVDGMVFHDAKTCPNNSNCRYGMPGRLAAGAGVPSVIVHSDLNDLRLHADEGVRLALEAFVEQCAEASP